MLSIKKCHTCWINSGFVPRDNGAHTARVSLCDDCKKKKLIMPSRHWRQTGCDHDWEDIGKYEQCTYPECQVVRHKKEERSGNV